MAPLSWVTAVIALPGVSCGCCIVSPFWSVGGGPRRQHKEEQELDCGHELENQGQLLLKPQHDHEGHHGEPLPSRPPEPFDPAGEAKQVRPECAAGWTDRDGGANAGDGEEPGQQQAEQSRSLIHQHSPRERHGSQRPGGPDAPPTFIACCKVEAIGDAVRRKLDRCTRKTRPKLGAGGQSAGMTRTFGRMDRATVLWPNDPKVGVLANAGSSYEGRALLWPASGLPLAQRQFRLPRLQARRNCRNDHCFLQGPELAFRRAAGWAPW